MGRAIFRHRHISMHIRHFLLHESFHIGFFRIAVLSEPQNWRWNDGPRPPASEYFQNSSKRGPHTHSDRTSKWSLCLVLQELRNGGRYRDRTYGPYHVKVVLSR